LLDPGLEAPRIVISERYTGASKTILQSAVFQGTLKLITASTGKSELYDLSADPGERNNLYRPDSPPATALAVSLSNWFQTTPRRYSSAPPANLDELRRLKSLGYVGQ